MKTVRDFERMRNKKHNLGKAKGKARLGNVERYDDKRIIEFHAAFCTAFSTWRLLKKYAESLM